MTQVDLKTFMASEPKMALEKIAEDYQTSLLTVIGALPCYKNVPATHFDFIWDSVTKWGKITFIVHTKDIILEFSGNLPEGYHKVGYFNLKHTEGLGGHIKAEHCHTISFIERKFMGMDTAAIVFLNHQGNAMFKIFVGRDEKHQLLPEQLVAFRQLASDLN